MAAMAERTWDVDAAQAGSRGPCLPVLALEDWFPRRAGARRRVCIREL